MNDNANPEPVAEPADAIRVTPDAAVYRGGVDPTLVVAGVAAAGVFLQGPPLLRTRSARVPTRRRRRPSRHHPRRPLSLASLPTRTRPTLTPWRGGEASAVADVRDGMSLRLQAGNLAESVRTGANTCAVSTSWGSLVRVQCRRFL